MRESLNSSKEDTNSLSDPDRSFERTRGSFIACINRSLEHAFEFLSETGYASGGLSDAERGESRSENDTEDSSNDLLREVNRDLKKRGFSELSLTNGGKGGTKKGPRPGQLWGITNPLDDCAEKDMELRTQGFETRAPRHNIEIMTHYNPNDLLKTVSEEYLEESEETSRKNRYVSEENEVNSGKKIIVYQHVDVSNEPVAVNQNDSINGSVKGLVLQNGDVKKQKDVIGNGKAHHVPKIDNSVSSSQEKVQNGFRCIDQKIENSELLTKKISRKKPRCKSMDNLSSSRRKSDREFHIYGSKAEIANRAVQNGHVETNGVKNVRNGTRERNFSDEDRREMTPYLTTERQIFKQLLLNAKESAKLENELQIKHRKSSRSLSNLDLRRFASKVSLGPSSRPIQVPKHATHFQRTSVVGPNKEKRGFSKFRESFRKKTSYFMPHKFRVQEEKENGKDIENSLEFQFHCMHEPRDNNEPITSAENGVMKKKGFFRNLFERSNDSRKSPRPKSFFKSIESLNQFRWHSKENLSRKHNRPISMLVDKVKDPLEEGNRPVRRGSLRGSRFFRRSESLRSIPSTTSSYNASLRRNSASQETGTESVRILKSSHNRPMSVHDMLSRVSSIDNYEDPNNLHKLLKNRHSCCSVSDDIFGAEFQNHDHVDMLDHEILESDVFTSSSPRKDDDITDWIRGLQFSSKSNGEKILNGGRKLDKLITESLQDDDVYDPSNFRNYFYETRVVDGQIQTYL